MRVRITIEVDVDPEVWVAAAVEEEWLVDGECANDPTNHVAVADAATAYVDAEDQMPRWARDSMSVISQLIEIVEPS